HGGPSTHCDFTKSSSMTSTPEQARTTAVDSLKPAGASRTRQNFDPTRLFVQRDRLPWIWFFLAVATVVFGAFDRWHLVNSFKRRERVVIIDPANTYYLSPLLQFQEAKELHAQQATLATLAFLERNPKDFDHIDLLKQVFLKQAFGKAQDQRQREAAEFRSKQLHQKAE